MRSLTKYIKSVIDPYLVNLKIIIENLTFPTYDKSEVENKINNLNNKINGTNGHVKNMNNPHSTKLDHVAHVGSSAPTDTSKKVWFNFL